MYQDKYNTLFWYYHPEYTYDLDPPDSGTWNQIRFWFGVYLDEWLWDYGNVEQWYLGPFPDSNERILINCLLTKEWIQVFYRLTLLGDISLRWGAVCPLLDNMETRFFHRSSIPLIIYLSMLLMTIMLLFWCSPLQRVHIHRRLRWHTRRWFIL